MQHVELAFHYCEQYGLAQSRLPQSRLAQSRPTHRKLGGNASFWSIFRFSLGGALSSSIHPLPIIIKGREIPNEINLNFLKSNLDILIDIT